MNFKILLIIFISYFGISSMTKFNINYKTIENPGSSSQLCFSVSYNLPVYYVLHTLTFVSQKPTYLKDFLYEFDITYNQRKINYKNELSFYISSSSLNLTHFCFSSKPPNLAIYIFSWEISVGSSYEVLDYDSLEFVYQLPDFDLDFPRIYMAQFQPPIPSIFKPLCVSIKYETFRMFTSLTLETIAHDLTSSLLYDIFEDKLAFTPLNLLRLDIDEKASAHNMICFRLARDVYKKITTLVWTIKDLSMKSQRFEVVLPPLAEESSQPIISIDFSENPALFKRDLCIKATLNSSSAHTLKFFATAPGNNDSKVLYTYDLENQQLSSKIIFFGDLSLNKNTTSGTTVCIANAIWMDAYRQYLWVVETYNNNSKFVYPFSFDIIDKEEMSTLIELVYQPVLYSHGDSIYATCTFKGSSTPAKISWFFDDLLLSQETQTNYSKISIETSMITEQTIHISLSGDLYLYATQGSSKYPMLICTAKSFSFQQSDKMLIPIEDVRYESTVKINEIVFEPEGFDYNTPFCISVLYSIQDDKVFDSQLIKVNSYSFVQLIYRFYKDDHFERRIIVPSSSNSSLQQKIDYNKTQGEKVCFKGIQPEDEKTLLIWSVNTLKGYEDRKEFYLMPNYTPPSTLRTFKPSSPEISEIFTSTFNYDNYSEFDNKEFQHNDYREIVGIVAGVVLASLCLLAGIVFYFKKFRQPKDEMNDMLVEFHQ